MKLSEEQKILLKDDLINVKLLIQQPENWLQGRTRSDENGKQCFCLVGAIVSAQT